MKILIVEDDYQNREYLSKFLKSKGHEVLVAFNGKEGAQICIKESLDYVITDMQMPFMNGDKMIREVLKRRPWVKFIAMSASAMWDIPAGIPLLLKPFHLDDLLEYLK